jgi:membrane-bound lytic murein transglycosylase MltF
MLANDAEGGDVHRLAAVFCLIALSACGREEPVPTAPDPAAGAEPSPIGHRPGDVASLDVPSELAGIVEPWFGDLDAMVSRRLVRAAVARSGFFYYIRDGREYGVTSELLQLFEKDLNRRLGLEGPRKLHVVAIPLTRDELINAVAEGRADIAGAGLTATPDRERRVDFTLPWTDDVAEIVVTGPVALPVETLADLSGREVVVRVSSSYYESLLALNADLEADGRPPVDVVPAHEIFEDEDLLEMASVGMIGITVVDDYVADFWSRVFPDLVVHSGLALRRNGRIAWAVRRDSPELAAAIDDFVRRHRRGTKTGNIILRRYLEDPEKVTNALAGDRLEQLSTEEPFFRKYGALYGFDWLMLAAQGYQESRLDNRKTSRAGAVGIMQVLPSTARSIGVEDFRTVDGNIRAGARYMRHLVDTYFPDEGLDPMNRWIFALASYNAGGTRIARLRRRAAADGLDPNQWFDNVERLTARTVGSEPVNYVRNVMKYYLAYRLTFEREALRREVLARVGDGSGGPAPLQGVPDNDPRR